jgi:hypothetical protein
MGSLQKAHGVMHLGEVCNLSFLENNIYEKLL